MLYYSKLRHKRVVTQEGLYVGKLVDLIFTFGDVAQVTKLHIHADPLRSYQTVSVEDIALFGDEIILKKNYKNHQLEDNEMYLGKNVVDKQIIDIEGKKVVRVNDAILLVKSQDDIHITGVDVGLLSIMRWIGLENIVQKMGKLIGIHLRPHILSWRNIQPLELSEGKIVLNTRHEKLESFLPEDLADYLEATNIRNVIKTLDLVDKEFASEVIAELQLNFQIALFEELGFKRTVSIIDLMDPDEAVDALLQFSHQKRTKILKALHNEKRKELQELISVSRTNVGQYMTTEYLTVHRNEKVQDVIKRVRAETADFDFLFYIYVVNSRNEIIGATDIHELLMQRPNTHMYAFMHTNIVLAHLNTPIRSVAKRMITYKLYALPVVERSRKIIGTILLDDIDEAILDHIG